MSDYERRINPVGMGSGGAGESPLAQWNKEWERMTKPSPQPQAALEVRSLTLPTDSLERKNYPLLSGALNYFPAAIAGVARVSKIGNDKHNPGQKMHHARGKSSDHGDCILRHLTDTEDLIAAKERGAQVTPEQILLEASQLAWRALAYSQELHEYFGAPLAPGAIEPLEPARGAGGYNSEREARGSNENR